MAKMDKQKADDQMRGYYSIEEIAQRFSLNGLLLFQDRIVQYYFKWLK